MRKRLILAFLLLLATTAFAATQKQYLVWTPPTTNVDGTPLTDLGGYNVYCGNQSGNYTVVKDVGNPPTNANGDVVYALKNILPANTSQTWYCAVTAYDLMGNESDYSNEVSFPLDLLPPTAPGTLRLQ